MPIPTTAAADLAQVAASVPHRDTPDWRAKTHGQLRRMAGLKEQQEALAPPKGGIIPDSEQPWSHLDRRRTAPLERVLANAEASGDMGGRDARFGPLFDAREIGADASVPAAEDLSRKALGKAASRNNHRNRRLPVDLVRKIEARFGVAVEDRSTTGVVSDATAMRVAAYQKAYGIEAKHPGDIDAATRQQMETDWPELRVTLLGPNLDPRVLVPGDSKPEDRYTIYKGFIEQMGGHFDETPGRVNIIAIRGVSIETKDGGLEIAQSASAAEFVAADAVGRVDDHFHGNRLDDVIVSVSISPDGAYAVRELRGTVDPNLFWTTDKDGKGKNEGSSHLADGQHVYKLGTHSTSHHGDDIREYAGGKNSHPVLGRWTKKGKRVRYAALQPVSEQVIRDGHRSDDHHLTEAEFLASVEQQRRRNGRYASPGISTNVHSSPNSRASSLGCMNIPLDEGYEGFIAEIQGGVSHLEDEEGIARRPQKKDGKHPPTPRDAHALHADELLFTLVDASKLIAGG